MSTHAPDTCSPADARIAAARANGWLARMVERGNPEARGPLSGMDFLAKDLFAIAGEPTVAASPAHVDTRPADRDARAIERLKAAGARLLGTTNMDSLAYGFVTQTRLYGTARNPHDATRLCGGSSGGSAAAVAAGLVPFALGTDTSGSIRVPAALCGVPGLKPGQDRISREGTQVLSQTLDCCGVFAETIDMLETVFGVLDEGDAAAPEDRAPLRYGRLTGFYAQGIEDSIAGALDAAAQSLDASDIPVSGTQARSAAYIIVAAEAGRVHAKALSDGRGQFDAAVRNRLCAALLVPDEWVARARAIAQDYTAAITSLFGAHDVLIAPAVPCLAPPIDAAAEAMPGTDMPLRAALGLFTQPLSLTGLPILTLPLDTDAGLPTGIQIIAPHGREERLFAAGRELIAACPRASRNPSTKTNADERVSR